MSEPYEFPFERQAKTGEQMPEGLSLADQMAYTTLSYIYRMFYSHVFDRDKASYAKQELRKAYEKAIEQQLYESRMANFRALILRETERAITECRKNPTPENAKQLCDIIDGIQLKWKESNDAEQQ